ncbi:MAG TPA: hypothetical protein PKG52_07520 [bacterium]|nr:hypothetical protein [bacterium]HPS29440.1 hypothetical protein [bacterium]
MKLLIVLSLFFTVVSLTAENQTANGKESESIVSETETEDDLIRNIWNLIEKQLEVTDVSFERKKSLLQEFIEKTPAGNSYRKKAENFVFEMKDSEKRLKQLVNSKYYRTDTEWLSLKFIGGNYGLGVDFSFFTFRWEKIYWEMIRCSIMNREFESDTQHYFLKTMFGIPFFTGFASRHEIRISTGISGGVSNYKSEENFLSFINIPFELSYTFHITHFFSFQIGTLIELPVFFDSYSNTYYVPVISGFTGFRI